MMQNLDGKRVLPQQQHELSSKRLRLDDLLNEPEIPQQDRSHDARQSSEWSDGITFSTRTDITSSSDGNTPTDIANHLMDIDLTTTLFVEDDASTHWQARSLDISQSLEWSDGITDSAGTGDTTIPDDENGDYPVPITNNLMDIDSTLTPLTGDFSTSADTSAKTCLGMITDINVKFVDNQQPSKLRSHVKHGSSFGVTELQLVDGRCNLKISRSDLKAVALLNMEDCKQLNKLVGKYELSFDGVFSIQQLEQPKDSLVTAISINVYCEEGKEDDVLAFAISKAGYLLQDPIWTPEGIQYKNPQYLELPESRSLVIDEDELVGRSAALDLSDQSVKYMRSYGLDYDEIFDDMAQHDRVSHTTVDDRIRTPLLDYQRAGLDFILRRESEVATDDNSLWELESDDADEAVYRHRITGATSPMPKETIGGILADEMGLGKSLTMLSAIIASLDDARSYSLKNSTFEDISDQSVIAAKSTLLVVPSALLIDNWTAEIEKHIRPGCLKYYKYHGHRRSIQWAELLTNDVILTTYGTIAAEANKTEKVLLKYLWYRVVLDEAHIVRNCSTHKFKAIRSLRSLIRWCMTGTPIQNTIEDFGSLLRFLRMPVLEENAQFRRHITSKVQPTKDNPNPDFHNLHILLKAICLRRNKGVLPNSKSIETPCEIHFSQKEQAEYRQLGALCLEALNLAESGHTSTQSHSGVLEAILKLRLFCNNGKLVDMSWTRSVLADVEEDFAILQQKNEATCNYCGRDITSVGSHDDPEAAKITKCRKLVCVECMETYRHGLKKGICPICEVRHGVLDASTSNPPTSAMRSQNVVAAVPHGYAYPTKLLELCKNVKAQDGSDKSIVFSFWKKTLDIVCLLFDQQQIPYLRLDGDVPYSSRKSTISAFQQSVGGTVLLMTLGIGAVGLNNLSVASQIHILEPQWNPAVESQAIGRVVRLGQQKEVRIVRYVVRGSIEKSVRERQIQKLRLSKEGVNEGQDMGSCVTTRQMEDLIYPNDTIDEERTLGFV